MPRWRPAKKPLCSLPRLVDVKKIKAVVTLQLREFFFFFFFFLLPFFTLFFSPFPRFFWHVLQTRGEGLAHTFAGALGSRLHSEEGNDTSKMLSHSFVFFFFFPSYNSLRCCRPHGPFRQRGSDIYHHIYGLIILIYTKPAHRSIHPLCQWGILSWVERSSLSHLSSLPAHKAR